MAALKIIAFIIGFVICVRLGGFLDYNGLSAWIVLGILLTLFIGLVFARHRITDRDAVIRSGINMTAALAVAFFVQTYMSDIERQRRIDAGKDHRLIAAIEAGGTRAQNGLRRADEATLYRNRSRYSGIIHQEIDHRRLEREDSRQVKDERERKIREIKGFFRSMIDLTFFTFEFLLALLLSWLP